jgi:hypothetical protein
VATKRAFESLSPTGKNSSMARHLIMRNKTTKRRNSANLASPFNDLVVQKKANHSDDGEIENDSDSFKSQNSSSSTDTEDLDIEKRNDVASVFT